MNFLYPGFLFALLAVAIPILIHLFNFRKFKKVYFTNVSFLKAVKEQQSSREQLRELLILLSRIMAIVFLVFAFAQPYFTSGNIYHPESGNLVNIYIDNSYSMGAVNKEGSLLDEAKRKAIAIARKYAPDDRFQLTTNDFEGHLQRLVGEEALETLIDGIKISPAHRSLQQVIHRMQAADPGKRNRFSYVLSDFQNTFTGKTAVSAAADNHISLIRLQASALPNVAVDSVWSLSPSHRPGDQEKFVVQLKNYADEPARDIAIRLLVNNQQKAHGRINIPAGKSVKDTLIFSGLSAGWQKAVVNIKDYPLVFDDSLRFTFPVTTGLKILHISGDPQERHITALFTGDPYFRLSTMPESNIVYSSFATYQLIILSGLKAPSSGLAQELKSYLRNGGTVAIFPDLEVPQPAFSSFLHSLDLPAVVSLSRDTVNVARIDLKNNLFDDVFEEVPAKLDLPRINRYFTYARNTRTSREDILELPGGQLFISRYQQGPGKLYLSATSLKEEDSNLPQHPIFVPLMYKLAFTSVMEKPLYYTAGKDDLLSTDQITLNANESLRLFAGQQEVIPEIRQVPGKTLLYIADQVRASAFYELRKGNTLLGTYAFNEDRSESDMHYAADMQLQQLFGAKKIAVNSAQANLSLAAVENNHTELWKLCLVLCAVFLAIEVLLIRFLNKKPIKT